MMKKRSKQNNPEQKTGNTVEMGAEYNPVKDVKQQNLKRSQPVKSKNHSEKEQRRGH
jgi:hypothetical protein